MKQDELMSRLFATSSKQILWMSSIRMCQPGSNFNRVKIMTLDNQGKEGMDAAFEASHEWSEGSESKTIGWHDIFRWMQNPRGTGTASGRLMSQQNKNYLQVLGHGYKWK